MKIFRLTDTDGTLALWNKNGEKIRMTDILRVYPHRKVYALRGQMGAGKTTFVKALCEEMGVKDVVNSPTFAIVNVYQIPTENSNTQPCREIYHFDCYRLKNTQEALDLGAEEYLYSGNYCFIEWPEMIEDILPEDIVNVEIQVAEDESRDVIVI